MGSGPGPPDGRSFHPFHCAQDQILHAQPPFISTALVCIGLHEMAGICATQCTKAENERWVCLKMVLDTH